jgi:hypothetical protein
MEVNGQLHVRPLRPWARAPIPLQKFKLPIISKLYLVHELVGVHVPVHATQAYYDTVIRGVQTIHISVQV